MASYFLSLHPLADLKYPHQIVLSHCSLSRGFLLPREGKPGHPVHRGPAQPASAPLSNPHPHLWVGRSTAGLFRTLSTPRGFVLPCVHLAASSSQFYVHPSWECSPTHTSTPLKSTLPSPPCHLLQSMICTPDGTVLCSCFDCALPH